MGNIAYPIAVPNTDNTLGKLRDLLSCNLELHFGIGELDFQASREGLSYIPQTVEAIKRKLEALNGQLAIHVAKEADAVTCLWTRAVFLMEKKDNMLWGSAVFKYVSDTKFPLIKIDQQRLRHHYFIVTVNDLATKYNINLRAFENRSGVSKCSTRDASVPYDHKTNVAGPKQWEITVGDSVHFVKNSGKVGAFERAKHHWRNSNSKNYSNTVFVMERVDKKTPAAFDAFIKSISSPPSCVDVSTLKEKPRKESMGKNVTIMKLERKGSNSYSRYSRTQDDVVWRDAGKSDSFDAKTVHYYLPLSGYIADTKYIKGVVNVVLNKAKQLDVKELFQDLKDCGVPKLNDMTVYGVRKGDFAFIKTQKNWVNLEDFIAKSLSVVDDNFLKGLAVQAIDNYSFIKYNNAIATRITDTDSPFLKLTTEFKDRKRSDYSQHSLNRLCANYTAGTVISPDALVKKVKDECEKVYKRYPLFKSLSTGSSGYEAVAEYINLIDISKKVKEV
jgi:plastocyanin